MMDGEKFLGTAQFLSNQGTDEAAYRSAVNRAYYACYLKARKVAFDNCNLSVHERGSIRSERGIMHDKLIIYFKHSPDMQLRKLGNELSILYGNRKDADYNMNSSFSVVDAQDAVIGATDFLKSFKNFDPRAIGKAMENYYKKLG